MRNKLDITEKSKRHFDSTAENYDDSSDGKFTGKMYNALLAELGKHKDGVWLDAGCGNGNVLEPLTNTALQLYGIDLSDKMMEEADKRLNGRAKLQTANAERLPFGDGMFDILVCNASFHHYPNPNAVLDEMNRVMRKGAFLYIGESYVAGAARLFMNIFIRFSSDGAFRIYGKRELTRLLEAHGFKLTGFMKTAKHAVLYTAIKQ